ncbi:hypothetical protein [Frankia sp. Cr2]|uniref:hypothetical protein n=1 Tax=Frankia sp. Cr2 TaxID=3073932 RepID=UPI002AD23B04|nr:hypothetical protein [Frankia sp. Cr2]
MDESGPVYGLVSFDGETRRSVTEIVLAFESAEAADRFAHSSGIGDYAIGPVGFAVSVAASAVRWRGDTR